MATRQLSRQVTPTSADEFVAFSVSLVTAVVGRVQTGKIKKPENTT